MRTASAVCNGTNSSSAVTKQHRCCYQTATASSCRRSNLPHCAEVEIQVNQKIQSFLQFLQLLDVCVCVCVRAQEHILCELQGVQKADHRGNRSRNGKLWKFSLKMSVKAVLTRSSMRGFTMGRKGLQLVFIIPSRTLSEMSNTAVGNS